MNDKPPDGGLILRHIAPLTTTTALIDNEGKVVGVITWGVNNEREQYNGAKSLDALCLKIIKCEYEYDGEKTWYDWKD